MIDLTALASPKPSAATKRYATGSSTNLRNSEPSSGTIVPLSRSCTLATLHVVSHPVSDEQGKSVPVRYDSQAADIEDHGNSSRIALSGLRPSCRGIPLVEDNTQRQMEVVNENFPKRRKAEAVGYAMKQTIDPG